MKAAVLALLLVTTSPAAASVYQWQWTGNLSGSGSLTTTPGGAFETVTSISGNIGDFTIYGIIPRPELIAGDRLYVNDPRLVDFQGIHFYVTSSNRLYETLLNSCPWTTAPCFQLDGDEIYPTYHAHSFADLGTFAVVPGPIVGAGLPGLLLAGASLLTFLRRKRN